MDNPETKLAEINRLLACYPPGNWQDAEEALRSYLTAVEDYPSGDVARAVTSLIKGAAPGVNPNFLPPPAAVGTECRRQRDMRLESEERTKRFRPALPRPRVRHDSESRARVADMVAGLVESVSERVEPEGSREMQRRKSVLERTNERFYPSMDERAMKLRLGYEVGDADGEAA